MSTHLLTEAPPRDRTAGVWDYISPTRLSLWAKCPLAFKLRYVDGLESPITPGLFLGRIVHAALERYYRHRQRGVRLEGPDLTAWLGEVWEPEAAAQGMRFDSAAQDAALRRQAADLVGAYLVQVATEESRPLAVEAAVESPLVDPASGEDLGIPLLGIMDLVLEEPSGPVITDFKTAARNAAPLEISHEIQLTAYAWLFRQRFEREETGLEIRSLVKTKVPQVQFHRYEPRTPRHFRRLFALVRAYLADLESGRFTFRPGMNCTICDYRDTHCPGWDG